MENIDILDGFGSFLDKNTIQVETKNETKEIFGEKIFINTGAKTNIPNIEGIKDNKNVVDSEYIMELNELPKRLTIIGGSYISLEFASMFAEFGSEVFVLDRGEVFLKREDRDIADEVKKILEEKGITIYQNAKTTKVEGSKLYFEKDGEPQVIEDTIVLIGTGRKANLGGLNLDKAGVEITDDYLIKVDEHLRTSQDNIWAMGDVAGKKQFTYISLDDYRVVKSDLSKDRSLYSK